MSRVVVIPTQLNWEVDSHHIMISRYEVGPLIDFMIPYIWVIDEGDEQRVPFFGRVAIELTREKYCISCFREIVDGLSDLCQNCKTQDFGIFHRCIIKEDSVLRHACTQESPACGIEWARRYCYEEHVVYIGTIGDLIKVGVTKLSKLGQSDNFMNRILGQGLLSAVVLRGIAPLSLLDAQRIEEEIALGWGIPEKINFIHKVEALRELFSISDNGTNMLVSLAKDIIKKLKLYKLRIYRVLDLSSEYIFPFDWAGDIYRNVRYINGRVIGFVGNVLFIDANGIVYAYNANNLIGRGIIDAVI